MSVIKYNLCEFFKRADEILIINNLIEEIRNCGNDSLIVDVTAFNFVDLSYVKGLICQEHITSPNKTVQFIETICFEDMKRQKLENGVNNETKV